MFVKLAALSAAVIAPLAFVAPAAHAGEHGGDCDGTRAVNFCPQPPEPTQQGYNLILGTRNADTLFGTHGDDAIFGRRGDDRLISRGGDDVLYGNQGDDVLIDNGVNFGPFTPHVVFHGGVGNDICIGTDNDTYLNCETVIIL
jgi:Ca2+-binding RTX toxin-like protein